VGGRGYFILRVVDLGPDSSIHSGAEPTIEKSKSGWDVWRLLWENHPRVIRRRLDVKRRRKSIRRREEGVSLG